MENSTFAIIGVLLSIFGSFSSWITSVMAYGFGQLIENSDKLVAWKNDSLKDVGLVDERLETLEKWKKQGLITEKEYNQKIENFRNKG